MRVREIGAERLDAMAPEDPLARGSRRDLGRINGIVRHAGIVAGALRPHALRAVLEIGAGDGAFLLRVARRLAPSHEGVRATLLDRHPLVGQTDAAGFARLGWEAEVVTADAFDYLKEERRFDAVVANFFLHHFPAGELRELLRLVALRTDLFVACEPRRSRPALAGTRMLWAIGCNEVTRYDARASVRAGFRGREIGALWPREAGWALRERAAAPFSHVFTARRTTVGEGG